MFKLIGVAVVVFIVFISWDTLSGLWKGDLSGEEAASAIRKDVSNAIAEPHKESNSSKSASNNSAAENNEQKPVARSVEQMADDLLKKK
jgi:hypothetical protein